MLLRSPIPPGHQNQVFEGCPQCGLREPFFVEGPLATAALLWWAGLAPRLLLSGCCVMLVGRVVA